MKTRSITVEGSNPPLDVSVTDEGNDVVLSFSNPMMEFETKGLTGFQLMEIGRFLLDTGIEKDNDDHSRVYR